MSNKGIIDLFKCIFSESNLKELFIPPYDKVDIKKLRRELISYFEKPNSEKLSQDAFRNNTISILRFIDNKKVDTVDSKKLQTNPLIKKCFEKL